MTDDSTRLTRRTALKGLGGTIATVGVGGAALLATSGPAAAATQDYGSVTITSDDGTVEYVAIYGDSTVNWDGFETEATQFSITIDARVDGSEWTNLYESGTVALDSDWGDNESLSGPGTSGTIKSAIGLDGSGNHDPTTDWHVVGTDPDGYGLPQNSLPASALAVGTDGDSQTYTVDVQSVYTWYDSSGAEIYSETFTAPVTVTVENEPTTVSSSGSGGATGA